ncbi:MAG TPA: hypothetical protein DFR83_27645, partial [Deltaproteobacteria bacterium]|nr:hypothetical protein [Deltaproteobacteria bacterium]
PFVLALYEGPSKPLSIPPQQVCVLRPGPLPQADPEERMFEQWESAMQSLPDTALARLDAWDPTHEAVVIVPSASQLQSVGGRPVFGGTPSIRHAIENKSKVDQLFAELHMETAPHQVVPLAQATAAAAALDLGQGTVWAGDNTSTIEAGARALAHVFDEPSAHRARMLLADRCKTVRVQPFLPGVPCSIQGICTPDGVALTVPTEMLVLRDPSLGTFLLVGMSTAWDPPVCVTER